MTNEQTAFLCCDVLLSGKLCTAKRALVRPTGCLEWVLAFAGPAAKPQAAMIIFSRETVPALTEPLQARLPGAKEVEARRPAML